MRELLKQIERALNAELYFLALYVALTLPDICGAIDSPNGEASKEKYKTWFDTYLGIKYGTKFTSDDCYYFRCSLLHQGSSQHTNSNYGRIIFLEPNQTFIGMHRMVVNFEPDGKVLWIELPVFCGDIIEGASTWLNNVENSENFKTNYDKFMRRYPDGVKPYAIGIPLIA